MLLITIGTYHISNNKKISFGCDLGYPNDLRVEIQTSTCKVLF